MLSFVPDRCQQLASWTYIRCGPLRAHTSRYPPMPAMDRCPLELWTRIVTFACTDGGYTGCSLSLVSHTMHNIAEPIRYRAISILGNQKLFAFAARLATMSKPPVIRHLLIADVRADRPDRPSGHDAHNRELMASWMEKRHKASEEEAAINRSLPGIISSAAPYLYTLVIHDWSYDPIFDFIQFPLLRDATLTRVPRRSCASDTHTRFPRLRRLHILYPSSVQGGLWDDLIKFAPQLTHLRLTGITVDTQLPPFLRLLLDIPPPKQDPIWQHIPIITGYSTFPPGSNDAQQALAVAAQLPALRYICVHPAIYKSHDSCGFSFTLHREMLSDLRRVANAMRNWRGATRKFVLLPKEMPYGAKEARKDWLNAIEGGEGPWTEGSNGLASTSRPAHELAPSPGPA